MAHGAACVAALHCTAGKVRPYRAAFDVADADEDDSISARDLQRVLRMMGTRATIEELRDIVRMRMLLHAVQYRMPLSMHACMHA